MMQEFPPIYGSRIVLRKRDPELLEIYHAKRFTSDVLRWADAWPRNPAIMELRKRFEIEEASPREWKLWIHLWDGNLIGETSMYEIDQTKQEAEFMIVVFEPRYWGQGYGTEAARLFLKDACRRFGLERVYLSTEQDNKRAIRSFEKLGFRVMEKVSVGKDRSVRMELRTKALIRNS